jgi:polysaccharide biosynthesis protein PslJ
VSASAVGDRSVQAAAAQPVARPMAESWFSWTGAIGLLVLVIWLIPIKSYTLPVHLPFSLELYRLLLIVFVLAWVTAALTGSRRIAAGGFAKPLILLACVGVLSIVANLQVILDDGLQTQALKSLSYFLSFLVVYLLVVSTLDSVGAVEMIVRALVAGGVVVAVAAVYESRTHYNVFQHLQTWVPFLHPTHIAAAGRIREGRLRVTASAQHPIALGAALTMAVPLAFYLVSRARTRAQAVIWWAAGGVLLAGAFATVSRTVVLMALAMVAAGLFLRPAAVKRGWPVLLVLLVAVHFAAPGAVSHMYSAFFPKQGLDASLQSKSGGVGSGRLADLGPGLRSWQEVPFFGHGLGTGASPDTVGTGAIVNPTTGAPIIFDDQYMNSLVSIGALGLIGVVWFVWGSAIALLRTARRRLSTEGDLIAACAVALVGFGAGMLTFDAFSFVQCTLIFFVIAALGLRVRALSV